jgi:hypothetical protein
MTTHDFDKPILLWVDRNDPGKGVKQLDCVEDAIAALFRADIGGDRANIDGRDHPIWAAALHRLSEARNSGCKEALLLAYTTMLQLVSSLGILVGSITGRSPDPSLTTVGK